MPLSPEIQAKLDMGTALYEADLASIRTHGKQLVSPFWALSKLGARFTPEGRKVVKERLLQSGKAQNVGFVDTKRGLRFPAENIDALDEAFGAVFFLPDVQEALSARFKLMLRKI